ncbi:hypothetical protein [Algisphaera agarilytica]|uniref:Uncharacterized protein n=1 Tax=Algisphaera agarilytica TaxID=1385975 RepID=A0A7X0H6U8_9BACT|nr:hypothetical protein [Algisphaera agarilytica]MBB6429201.1 hypothetical protein [Algisphaera agarilytica]
MPRAKQLTRFEWNTSGKDRVEAFREIGSPDITVHVYDVQGKITVEHSAPASCRESVLRLARSVQPHIDGCPGSNSMVHGVFCFLEYFLD